MSLSICNLSTMAATLTALVSWFILGQLWGRSIAHTRWDLPLCLLSSDWESGDSSNSNLMTRRVLPQLFESSCSLWVLKLAPSTVALTGHRIVYPSCILCILGGYLFLFIVTNQGFESHGGKRCVMTSHHSCQKTVRMQFILWKVPLFEVWLCTFIHSLTYSTGIHWVFLMC